MKKIGVVIFNIGNTIRPDGYSIGHTRVMVDQIKKSADQHHVAVDIQCGKNDPIEVIKIIKRFITEKYDAIIMYSPGYNGVASVLDEAGLAGIPLFSLNIKHPDINAMIGYVGADDYVCGQQQMEILKKNFPNGASFALLTGMLGTSAKIDRTDAVEDFLKENSDLTLVDRQADDWNTHKALAITKQLLAKFPKGELDAIVVQGPHATTAVEYAVSIGREEIQWIFGDYNHEVAALIKSGSVLGTFKQDFAKQAAIVTKIAADWVLGENQHLDSSHIYIDTTIVTRKNVHLIQPDDY